MHKHLFFQGPIYIGKSTYLRNEINCKPTQVCGLTVQRVIRCAKAVGYQVASICQCPLPLVDIEYRCGMEGVFLLDGKKDISVLEKAISKTEEMLNNTKPQLIVLDEIGGMELVSNKFMLPLMRILANDTPCIGVLKSKKNLKHTVSKLQLQSDYLTKHAKLVRLIEENGEIISVEKDNLDIISTNIERFLSI